MPTVAQIVDLVNTTRAEEGKNKITNHMLSMKEYVAAPELFKKNRMSVESGDSIEFTYAYQNSGAAHHTKIGATESVDVPQLTVRGSVPWRFSTTNYMFDRREKGMNSGEAKIFDLIKLRREASVASWIELAEDTWWSKPADSTDDETPFGLDYWIVGASGAPSFQGGNPTGFSSGRAGISSSTYTRFQNYAGVYTAISRADLVAKMREAAWQCGFKSPINLPEYSGKSNHAYYTTYDVVSQFETLLEGQNENLGNDVAAKDGMVKFRGNNVVAVPKLQRDNSSTDPIYGVDWGTMKVVVKSGGWQYEHPPMTPTYRPNEVINYVDFQYNFVCYDPRRNFKLNK